MQDSDAPKTAADLVGLRRPDFARLDALNRAVARSRPVDYEQNFRIVNALYEEAVALGVWRRKDPLEGIDDKIRVATILQALRSV